MIFDWTSGVRKVSRMMLRFLTWVDDESIMVILTEIES